MRVSGLLHYGLQVPSLDEGSDFYRTFGLDVSERASSIAVRCTGRDQDQAVLREGPDKRLHHVAFAITPGTQAGFQRQIEGQGISFSMRPPTTWPAGCGSPTRTEIWSTSASRSWPRHAPRNRHC